MKPNEWLALVDVFELFQLKRYCTEAELKNIEKVLELEILATLSERYSPELPNEAQTLDVIAEVKKTFIIEYVTESQTETEDGRDFATDVEVLLNDDTATPEALENLLNEFYLSEDV